MRVCLGVIATAHGVKGLVKILCYAQDPYLLDGTVFASETGDKTVSLQMKNSMGKYWLAEVAGIDNRDAALALRGTKLWADREALPVPENEDEFYIEDLVGLKVCDTAGRDAGTVIAVDNFGAGDLLEIKPSVGESYYLAFTKQNVPAVDIAGGTLTVAPPEDTEA